MTSQVSQSAFLLMVQLLQLLHLRMTVMVQVVAMCVFMKIIMEPGQKLVET